LSTYLLVSLFVVGLGAWLTVRDYFGTWTNEYIVRFQYHAPTREVAHWLDQHPEITGIAIGTNPNQLVLDPLALKLDLPRDIPVSWFNAESALATSPDGLTVLTALQAPGAEVRQILSDTAQLIYRQPEFEVYASVSQSGQPASSISAFDGGRLALRSSDFPAVSVKPGDAVLWRTAWQVNQPLTQPRLKMFLHVLNEQGTVVVGADREDVNFATLSAGTSFWQISQLTLPGDLPTGQYQIEVGWYNPETGERLKRADGSDRYLLPPLDVVAP
jgi:hypothetical protein